MNLLSVTHLSKNAAYDQMAFRVAQQRFEESRIDRSLNSDIRTTQEESVDAYSLNLDFTKFLDPKHRIFYGIEYVFNKVTSAGQNKNIVSGISATGPSRYPQASWQSMGKAEREQKRRDLIAQLNETKAISNRDWLLEALEGLPMAS